MSRKNWLEQLNTKTTDEQNFQTAYRIMATKWGLSSNPDDPRHRAKICSTKRKKY